MNDRHIDFPEERSQRSLRSHGQIFREGLRGPDYAHSGIGTGTLLDIYPGSDAGVLEIRREVLRSDSIY